MRPSNAPAEHTTAAMLTPIIMCCCRAFSHLGDSSSVIRPLLCMPQLARLTLRSDGGAILLVEPAWLQAAGTQLQHLTASLTQSAGVSDEATRQLRCRHALQALRLGLLCWQQSDMHTTLRLRCLLPALACLIPLGRACLAAAAQPVRAAHAACA